MAEEKGSALVRKLAQLRREAEERDAKRRAESLHTQYADVGKIPIDIEAVKIISEAEARTAKAAAVQQKVREVALAVFDSTLPETKTLIARLEEEKYHITLFIVSLSALEQVWHFYGFISKETHEITGSIEIERVRMDALIGRFKTFEAVQKELQSLDFKKTTTTGLFEIVLAGALTSRASDIHFEAEEKSARIRFRIDGLLHDVFATLPQHNYRSVLSRIKLLSGLKINVRGEPQDGRFTVKLVEKEIEMRVSIIPSEFGETIVMRVLDPSAISVEIVQLGLRPDDFALVTAELKKPHGLVLNTGPTGSGKTTTLYAFLRTMVNPEIKIITIEDPIEYRVQGIEQTQVDVEAGYTFASGLRAIVRQDPDVILVGEIRDLETADIALQASLTGHMVFSTLHTNDAVGAVPRMVDLGAKAASIGPALSLVIAQRLVRKLCEKCKKPKEINAELKAKISSFMKHLPTRVDQVPYTNPTFFSAAGCDVCNQFGYKGRNGIFEFFLGGPELERLVLSDPSALALKALAKAQGMVTMQEDGILKALQGTTTLEEVEEATGPLIWG